MKAMSFDGPVIRNGMGLGCPKRTTRKRPENQVNLKKELCMGAFLLRCAEVVVITAITVAVSITVERLLREKPQTI